MFFVWCGHVWIHKVFNPLKIEYYNYIFILLIISIINYSMTKIDLWKKIPITPKNQLHYSGMSSERKLRFQL